MTHRFRNDQGPVASFGSNTNHTSNGGFPYDADVPRAGTITPIPDNDVCTIDYMLSEQYPDPPDNMDNVLFSYNDDNTTARSNSRSPPRVPPDIRPTPGLDISVDKNLWAQLVRALNKGIRFVKTGATHKPKSYMERKKAGENTRNMMTGAVILMLILIVIAWRFNTASKPTRKIEREELQRILHTIGMGKVPNDYLIDVHGIRVKPEWPPIGMYVDMTEDEVQTGYLSAPFSGSIAALIGKNLQIMSEFNRPCAGPQSYTVPLNMLTLRASEETFYNVEITNFIGNRKLILEKSLRSDTKRSSLYAEHIEISHMFGLVNITDRPTAFCIQSYFVRDTDSE